MSPVVTAGFLATGALVLTLLAACQPAAAPVPDPAQDFVENCAGCHGTAGRGDGPLAADLPTPPADLTRLSVASGGVFPTTQVMAQIWGYAGAKSQGVMPAFSALMAGETVPYDGGDGIMTPTPLRLVALAEYLKSLQRD